MPVVEVLLVEVVLALTTSTCRTLRIRLRCGASPLRVVARLLTPSTNQQASRQAVVLKLIPRPSFFFNFLHDLALGTQCMWAISYMILVHTDTHTHLWTLRCKYQAPLACRRDTTERRVTRARADKTTREVLAIDPPCVKKKRFMTRLLLLYRIDII